MFDYLIYIHYVLYFSDKTEAEDNATDSGNETGQISDGTQLPSDKTESVYYKMFLFDMFQSQLFAKYE